MRFLEQSATQSGDDLDNLLRAFFQAEMPTPWPPAPETTAKPIVLPARKGGSRGLSPLVRSRLALAASVALLISGPLFLAHRHADAPPAEGPDHVIKDSAATPVDPRGPKHYGNKESLIQKSDGTYIQIEVFELPPSK
jgi:hypothetical protein